MVMAGLLAYSADPIPGELIAYGRRMPISGGTSRVLYTVEGRTSSVAITLANDGSQSKRMSTAMSRLLPSPTT